MSGDWCGNPGDCYDAPGHEGPCIDILGNPMSRVDEPLSLAEKINKLQAAVTIHCEGQDELLFIIYGDQATIWHNHYGIYPNRRLAIADSLEQAVNVALAELQEDR